MYRISDRNAAILAFAKSKRGKWSYQLIADHFKVSRSVVAGILFRAKHPVSERVHSPRGLAKNKIGTGFKPSSYYPDYTAANTRS